MSTRSLRRRLVKEDTSFRQISDEALNHQAKELIKAGTPFDAVAEKLGYADERSFRRAFLRWNDVTPSFYRKTAKSGAIGVARRTVV